MSILITAATDFELRAFDQAGNAGHVLRLLTGIGPVETAYTLTAMLCRHSGQISAVINFGIAGAFPCSGASMLDICIAEQEVLGDLGLCLPEDRIERLSERGLTVKDSFVLDAGLRQTAEYALRHSAISCKTGTFVTVSCASGTEDRARRLGRQFQGLCENMEGAAVARVCEAFQLPCLELRCVSNIAGERNRRRWRLHEACLKAGHAAAIAAAALKEGLLPPPSAGKEMISRF